MASARKGRHGGPQAPRQGRAQGPSRGGQGLAAAGAVVVAGGAVTAGGTLLGMLVPFPVYMILMYGIFLAVAIALCD